MTITKENWYLHPSFRQELAALLENETLRIAIEITKDIGSRETIAPSGTFDLVQYFALMGARKDGWAEGLRQLEMLAKAQPAPVPDKKPWSSPKPTDEPPVSAGGL